MTSTPPPSNKRSHSQKAQTNKRRNISEIIHTGTSKNPINNLRVSQKLILLSSILLIPTVIALGNNIYNSSKDIFANQKAIEDFEVSLEMGELEHKVLVTTLLADQYGLNPQITMPVIQGAEKEAREQEQIVAKLMDQRKLPKSKEIMQRMMAKWYGVIELFVEQDAMTPNLADDIRDVQIRKMSAVFKEIAEESNIAQAVSYTNLIQSANELSIFNHYTAPQKKTLTAGITTSITNAYLSNKNPDGSMTKENIVLYRMDYAYRLAAYEDLNLQMEKVLIEQKGNKDIEKAAEELKQIKKELSDYAENNIVGRRRLVGDLETFNTALLGLNQRYTEIFALMRKAQKDYHKKRSDEALQNVILLSLIMLGIIALSVFFSYLIAQAIFIPIRELTAGAKRITRGNYSTHVPVKSTDELGLLSRTMNDMSHQLSENERAQAIRLTEAHILQENINEFLDITMDIAEGDLTKRGKVTEDVLGNVVDSINLMTTELGEVLKEAQYTSNAVIKSSQNLLISTEDIANSTNVTADGTQEISTQLEQLIKEIRIMASQAQESAETARQALLVSQHGQAAVSSTLNGMQNIRREVQSIAKRIKGLGDRSLEIQEIVDTISKISQQTDLLALNASIEAEGAGEAGGRFSIVADEVRKLADTSSQATTRIASLIKTVQTEVQDVVESVEEGTREVEIGYQVAGTAGERLREIGQLTEKSAKLAESIAQSTQIQVNNVEKVGITVQEIATLALRSQNSVYEGKASAEQLEEMAQKLGNNLVRFRLPE